jgi:hypothetical protein
VHENKSKLTEEVKTVQIIEIDNKIDELKKD